MKIFGSDVDKEISMLESERKKINEKLALLKKEPLAWIKNYFKDYPNLGLCSITPDHYRGSILVVISKNSLPPWVAQHILRGIGYMITEVIAYTDNTFRIRLEDSSEVKKRMGY